MPDPLTTYILNADVYWGKANNHIKFAGLNLSRAATESSWLAARKYIGYAGNNLTNAYEDLDSDGASVRYWTNLALMYIDDNLAGDLTMRAILDVMFTAGNEELKQFIGLVDAYRQSLWNKPFDKEFWAATARGFEQWEF